MLDALQLVGAATVPLKVIVLLPCAEPKFVPVMVTAVPTGPEIGLMLLMLAPTVKTMLLLNCPPPSQLRYLSSPQLARKP